MEEEQKSNGGQEVYSNVVRAGKRTYFFDVKATHNNDLYISVTESKKTFVNGRASYQKHKIFLYKEDFEKFSEALKESIEKIQELKNEGEYIDSDVDSSNHSSIEFEDLT